MRTSQTLSLFASSFLTAGTCWWFFHNDRMHDCWCVLMMTTLHLFFILGDARVDNLCRRDLEMAKHKRGGWDNYQL